MFCKIVDVVGINVMEVNIFLILSNMCYNFTMYNSSSFPHRNGTLFVNLLTFGPESAVHILSMYAYTKYRCVS